jgi:zinc D-Ala-D-Ala dipeptidase
MSKISSRKINLLGGKNNLLPSGFLHLSEITSIIQSPRYYTNENFLGRPVPGYANQSLVCTIPVAERLAKANTAFNTNGFNLVIYDAYRSQRSVDYFFEWSRDISDQVAKDEYYPTIEKESLFDTGFIAQRSSHSRGCAVDVSIIPLELDLKSLIKTKRILPNGDTVMFLDDNTADMGSSFDLFHEISYHDSPWITEDQKKMRKLLRSVMTKHGFSEYAKEWWHYNLSQEDEMFPDTYFNFTVTTND